MAAGCLAAGAGLSGCASIDAQTRPAQQPAGQAGDLAAAKRAYDLENYRRAAVLLLPLARQGDVDAQYALGYLYYYGLGVPRDAQRAVYWIGQAASRGHEKAQRALLRVSGGPPDQHAPGPSRRPGTAETPEPSREVSGEPPPGAPSPQPSLGPPDQALDLQDDGEEESSGNPAAQQAPQPTLEREFPGPMPSPALTPARPAERAETAQKHQESRPRAGAPALPETETTEDDLHQEPVREAGVSASDDAGTPRPRDTEWVREQPAGHFTIQLVATSSARRVNEYMQRHGLIEKGAYFQSALQGRPWFSVLYGSYPTFDEARRALAGLQPALRDASPYIRDFGDVQREIAGQ